jgi:hypothetical protein
MCMCQRCMSLVELIVRLLISFSASSEWNAEWDESWRLCVLISRSNCSQAMKWQWFVNENVINCSIQTVQIQWTHSDVNWLVCRLLLDSFCGMTCIEAIMTGTGSWLLWTRWWIRGFIRNDICWLKALIPFRQLGLNNVSRSSWTRQRVYIAKVTLRRVCANIVVVGLQ